MEWLEAILGAALVIWHQSIFLNLFNLLLYNEAKRQEESEEHEEVKYQEDTTQQADGELKFLHQGILINTSPPFEIHHDYSKTNNRELKDKEECPDDCPDNTHGSKSLSKVCRRGRLDFDVDFLEVKQELKDYENDEAVC